MRTFCLYFSRLELSFSVLRFTFTFTDTVSDALNLTSVFDFELAFFYSAVSHSPVLVTYRYQLL